MKTKYILYAGGGLLAYLAYTGKLQAMLKPKVVAAPAPVSAFGAYSTGNPMMEALGSLGCANGQVPGLKGY